MMRWFRRWFCGETFSRSWWSHLQRHEMSRGIDQSRIDWQAMKDEAYKR